MQDIPRRDFILKGSAALTAMAFLRSSPSLAYPGRPGEEVIPWADQPPPNADPNGIRTLLKWEDLDSWITPNDKFFCISHFNRPSHRCEHLEAGDRRPREEAA